MQKRLYLNGYTKQDDCTAETTSRAGIKTHRLAFSHLNPPFSFNFLRTLKPSLLLPRDLSDMFALSVKVLI